MVSPYFPPNVVAGMINIISAIKKMERFGQSLEVEFSLIDCTDLCFQHKVPIFFCNYLICNNHSVMCLLNKTEISGFLGSSPKGDEVLYNTGSSCPFVHLSVYPFVHLFVPPCQA